MSKSKYEFDIQYTTPFGSVFVIKTCRSLKKALVELLGLPSHNIFVCGTSNKTNICVVWKNNLYTFKWQSFYRHLAENQLLHIEKNIREKLI